MNVPHGIQPRSLIKRSQKEEEDKLLLRLPFVSPLGLTALQFLGADYSELEWKYRSRRKYKDPMYISMKTKRPFCNCAPNGTYLFFLCASKQGKGYVQQLLEVLHLSPNAAPPAGLFPGHLLHATAPPTA